MKTVKKAVIPAAGLGTRMLPATKTVPKEMLPIIELPSIQYIIEEAVASGIEDILVLTNRAKTVMEDYFDYFPELEQQLEQRGKFEDLANVRRVADMANISFVRQKETKGLGHAIWCARNFVGEEPFAVLLGDDIMYSSTPVTRQLCDVYEKFGCSVVGVQEVSPEAIRSYSSIKVNPVEKDVFEVVDLIEKPLPDEIFSLYAILGRYVLSPSIFNLLETLPPGFNNEIQLTDGLVRLCKSERLMALNFEGKRYDTGNVPGYLETVVDFALRHPKYGSFMRSFIKSKALEIWD